jgi:DNA polymerase-3 subunit delta'
MIKKLIGIAQIQELISKLYESPFLAKNKVVIIPNLEKLSIDGLNAILKILEEPPKDTYFLLTTSFLNQVPLTIQSRCFDIKIGTPNKELALEWLSDFSEEEGSLALSLTNNLPLLAKELLKKNILNEREQFIKEISSIIKEGKNLIFTSEKWIEDKDFLNLKLEWMSKLLCDSIKFNANNQIDNLTIDTDNITKYLAKNTDVNNLHNLLSKTNRLWNLFSKDTNLRKDYQLNSLFVDWESSLGISKKI